MKLLYRKFLTALLFLFVAFNAKAVSDTLTIGLIFNWQVGDTFMYRPSQTIVYLYPTTTYDPLEGFTVLGKQHNGDSIIYQVKYLPSNTIAYLNIASADSVITTFQSPSSLFNPFWYGLCICDSTIPSCADTSFVGIDSNLNYLTITTSLTDVTGSCNSSIEEKIGLIHSGVWVYPYESGIPPFGNYMDLVYYSSGATTWIDSANYFYNSISSPTPAPSFHLSPNPANDELTITTENEATVDVYIYDMLGNCVLSHKNFSPNLGYIKVFSLPPGYYLLKLTDQRGLSSSKGFVIAR